MVSREYETKIDPGKSNRSELKVYQIVQKFVI